MKHSFISIRKKDILSWEGKIIASVFALIYVILISSFAFLFFKYKNYDSNIKILISKGIKLNDEISDIESNINFINDQLDKADSIFSQNLLFRDSIKNLFDLVPDRITLSEARLTKKSLVLYGITPTKDVYNFLLLAPLKSIFHRSYSSFYVLDNGWYRFVSTNYLDEDGRY